MTDSRASYRVTRRKWSKKERDYGANRGYQMGKMGAQVGVCLKSLNSQVRHNMAE